MENQNKEQDNKTRKVDEKELSATLEDKKKEIRPNDKKTLVKIYLIPMMGILLFFYIVFFLIFGKISSIFNQLDLIDSRNLELNSKQAEVSSLEEASKSVQNIQSSLGILNSLAPSAQTEVVEFQEKVEILAVNNGLTITSQRLNDQSNESGDLTVLELKQIPSVFEIVGPKQNIDNFLRDFSNIDDFIVVSEMLYSGSLEDDLWRLELTTIKYQFGEANSEVIDSYEQISIDATIPPTVEKYINERL